MLKYTGGDIMSKLINSMLALSIVLSMTTGVYAKDKEFANGEDYRESAGDFEIESLLEKKNAKTSAGYEILSGRDRIDTSIKASQKTYPNGSNSAVIVNGYIYADSISAIPVAENVNGPILLTSGREPEDEIKNELKRLGVKNIILVGGKSSISEKFYEKLSEEKYSTSRISGANRYLTNREVINKIFDKSYYDKAVFVSGENFADSISAGVYAYKSRSPIILVPSKMDDDTRKYLSGMNISNPILVGGTRYLPEELDRIYTSSKRYAGLNRYDTSYMINTKLFSQGKNLVITTGSDFADALSGVPYAAKNDANLVLYDNNPRTYINSDKYTSVVCLGGRISAKLESKSMKKWMYSEEYVKSADLILSNKLPRRAGLENRLEFNGDFDLLKNEFRGVRRHLYGFFYLNDLANAFEETGNRAYIDKGMDLIRRFENEKSNIDDEMVWHDETTARRLDYYLRFYSLANILINSKDKDMMNKAMYQMATKMISPEFWAGNYNHGLFQDMSVLRYADYVNDRGMFKLAVGRAAEYFNTHFDSEGVHIENSPEYHFVMLRELSDFLKSISKSDTTYYDTLKNKFELSKKYSRAIILPSGYLPVVGDTGMIEPKFEEYYGHGRGDFGYQIERLTFKNAGYDIAKGKDVFLMLRAGYLTDIHHHNDDLSFWLYKNGNIFTEAGAFGYEYSNPLSQYVRSFRAHNSLVVDADNGHSGSGRYVKLLDGDSTSMEAVTQRPKNSHFTRKIKYNSDMTEISINDKIKATDDAVHKYELYFHLDPDIDVVLEEGVAILKRNSMEIGRMTSTVGMRLDKDIFCKNYSEDIRDTRVIVLETNGKDQVVDTKIELK